MAAAVIGSLIPRNADWVEAKEGEGVTIYIHDNGVHTSFIIKRDLEGNGRYDLGTFFADPPLDLAALNTSHVPLSSESGDQLPDSRFPGLIADFPWIMIGWGDARFYQETPQWADVRPGTALAAVAGSGKALVHVDRIKQLPQSGVHKLNLTMKEFQRILEFAKAQVEPKNWKQNEPATVMPGYGPNDRFFEATNEYSYSALFTCNNWVSEGLAQAGVKTGAWTPLPFGVMWWY